MRNILIVLAVASVAAAITGCSTCSGPFDYDYPTFGGKHSRAVRNHGRVGSLHTDTFVSDIGPGADSNLSTPDAPEEPNLDDDDGFDLDDDLDRDKSESDRGDGLDLELKKLDEELEGIEPLRDEDDFGASESTASNRWRPRPLRDRKQVR